MLCGYPESNWDRRFRKPLLYPLSYSRDLRDLRTIIPQNMIESGMCYNYILHIDKRFTERFSLRRKPQELEDKYDTSPLHKYPVITKNNQLLLMNWGLTPSWAKTKRDTIANVRSETVASKDIFKDSFAKRRCLVPATAFTEWNKDSKPKKRSLVKLKSGNYFAFAGIYDESNNYAIITTVPNEVIAPIHNRMPVVLRPEDEVKWISDFRKSDIDYLSLFKPYPADEMEVVDDSTRS